MARAPAAPSDAERLRRLEEAYAHLESRLRRVEGQRPPAVNYGGWIQNAPTTAPPPIVERARPDLETVLGGNLLAKAGMAVLVLGVVFFFKYAFDQGWIDERGRVLLGVVGGLVLAVVGDLLLQRRRYGVYPQVLAGGGFVIAYFSLYVAYAFPEYRAALRVTLEADVVLLGLTALALVAYASWRQTPVLAGEAVILGGVTSVVADEWHTFAILYLFVLAIAVVAAAALRRWPLVATAAMVVAYADVGVGLLRDAPATAVLGASAGFLVVFTVASIFLRDRVPAVEGRALGAGAFFGTWLLALAAFDRLLWVQAGGPTTASLAVLAAGLAFWNAASLPLRQAWGTAACVLALAWPPIQFDGVPVPLAWSGLAIAAGAVHFARPGRVTLGFLVVALASAALHLFGFEAPPILPGGVDPAVLLAFALATVAGVWGWSLTRSGDREAVVAGRVALAVGLCMPLLLAQPALEGFQVAIAWAAEALVLVVAGFGLGIRDLRLAGLIAFGLVLGHVFLLDIGQLSVVVRIITFLAVGALILVASFLFARSRKAAPVAPAVDPMRRNGR